MERHTYQRRLTYQARQTSLLERVLFALGGVAVIVFGFFFLTVALIVGALLALVIVVRLWWLSRKLRRTVGEMQRERPSRDGRNIVEGEYEVVDRPDSERRHPEH